MEKLSAGKKTIAITIPLLLLVSVVSACGQSNSSTPKGSQAPASTEPVKLTFYPDQTISDDDFNTIFTEPLKSKFPNITLQKIDTTKNKLADLIAAGDTPDIIFTYSANMSTMGNLGLVSDLTPLIKSQNVDLNRIDPVVLSATKDDKGVYALPLNVQFNALYYNKDIFDKFGVAYPKDGMTWDDTIALARKVTRSADDVQYRGLDPESLARMSFSKSLTFVDAKTEKAAIGSPDWRKVFEMLYAIYNIPGNMPPSLKSGSVAASADAFIKNKVVAMWPTVNVLDRLNDAEKMGLHWDMAQYPSYQESPNVYGTVDAHELFVSPTSKNKEQAMQVIKLALSDEVQLISVKQTGRFTALKNEDIKKQFGADNPALKGKNIQAIFKSKNGPPQVLTRFEGGARNYAYAALPDYITGKTDLNTMIQNTEEAINKYVDSQKSGAK